MYAVEKKWPLRSCIGQFVFPCGTKEVNYRNCVLEDASLYYFVCVLFVSRPSGDERRLRLVGNYG